MAGPLLWKIITEKEFELLEPSKAVGLFLFAACTLVCLFLNRLLPALSGNTNLVTVAALAALLWIADLSSLPFQLVYRVPDPYQNPAFQQQAEAIRREAGGKRILGVQLPYRLLARGKKVDEELEKKSSELFVENILPNTNACWGLRSVSSYLSLQTGNAMNIDRYINKGFPYGGDLLDIAGVRVFVMHEPIARFKYPTKDIIGDNYIILNPQASEDFRWLGKQVDLPDKIDILNTIAGTGSGWRWEVYLEKTGDGVYVHLPPPDRLLPAADEPAANRDNYNRVSAGMLFPGKGYAVLNESYAPGWHAWMDGKPVPILRAYGLFMAVPAAESGFHRLDFRYEPGGFRLGLFLSLIGLAGGIYPFLRGLRGA
jgi:hypothetical protein